MNRKNLVLTLSLSLGSFGCGQGPSEISAEPEVTTSAETALNKSAAVSRCTIFNENACILNTTKSTRSVEVHYPGLSHCSLRLLSTSSRVSAEQWNNFLSKVEIQLDSRTVQPALSLREDVASIDLGDVPRYLSFVTVRTLDGSSLDALVAASFSKKPIGEEEMIANHLLAVPVECPSAP